MVLKILITYIIFFNFSYLYANNIGSDTGYKLPRYVSLKSNEVNLRIGPSTNFPIKLKYIMKNFPVEIIDEYKQWRQVNDFEGNSGWIHKSLLKGDRYAVIYDERKILSVYNKPYGKLLGKIENYNIIKLKTCLNNWCLINAESSNGWVLKESLWGVYEKERFNVPFYQPVINQFWKLDF
tara:strand:- start:61 stop:600 length:540 start_codon:yes stop_codon:yes gene_type:complete